jgi:GT2 family glycosyltransferase
MNLPAVAVVIVNWNRWDDTTACVASVLATGYMPLQIIVVDNGSDCSNTSMQSAFPSAVELVRSPTNVGFAAGVNLGISRALAGPAGYIFTLNNDAVIDEGCLHALVAAANQRDSGIVGPKIVYRAAPERIWFAGAQRSRWSLSTYGYGRGERDGPAFAVVRRVNYLCAGAMLIRRDLLEAIGLFHPGYFMYYEDCEFCLRAEAAGFRLWYEPSAQVLHTVAASSGGEGSPTETYFRTVSVFRFIVRNSVGWQRRLLIAARMGWVGYGIMAALVHGRGRQARALWRGAGDGLLNRQVDQRRCESL